MLTIRELYSFDLGLVHDAITLSARQQKGNSIMKNRFFAVAITLLMCASAAIASAQTESVIYSFGENSEDGGEPLAGLIADQTGALYGTTSFDGPTSQGIVYKLTPPSAPGGAWTESILYAFLGTSGGSEPRSNLENTGTENWSAPPT
jgi:uncharacterized repeat protein (TIGR03803 family)